MFFFFFVNLGDFVYVLFVCLVWFGFFVFVFGFGFALIIKIREGKKHGTVLTTKFDLCI